MLKCPIYPNWHTMRPEYLLDSMRRKCHWNNTSHIVCMCVCVWVLCLCIWLCALCKQKPEEDSDSPRIRVTDSCWATVWVQGTPFSFLFPSSHRFDFIRQCFSVYPGYPGICCIGQAGLELEIYLPLLSRVLGLKACTLPPSLSSHFLTLSLSRE